MLLYFTNYYLAAQNNNSKQYLSINMFRNPSIGLEYRYNDFSIHSGYYPTNFESNVTTEFIRTGITYWFLPFSKKEIPSSFYTSISFSKGLTKDYKNKDAGMIEAGISLMIFKGINFRIGTTVLFTKNKKTEINPTPGLNYTFKL